MQDDSVDAGAWYRPARVHIDEYDARWPEIYQEEALRIAAAIGIDLIAIEHVGSTAVPGMAAKPIIDILAAVTTWVRLDDMVTKLRELGYVYTPESEADDPNRRVFRKGPTDMSLLRTHHLHITDPESLYWQRIIAFRDQLRSNAADAAAYIQLKNALAADFAHDSRSYTAGKQEFVTAMERKRGVIA
ncbi:MAG: GrpB family protein [Microthrixaceae bacterium]